MKTRSLALATCLLSWLTLGAVEATEIAETNVHIYYDEAAAKLFADEGLDIEDEIEAAVAEANAIYSRSKALVRVRLAYVAPLPLGVIKPGSWGDELDMVVDLEGSKKIASLRTKYEGSLVSLVSGTVTASIGSRPRKPQDYQYPQMGYSVVAAGTFRQSYGLVHEWGHAYGCDHDIATLIAEGAVTTPANDKYYYARGWVAPDSTCDIMSYNCFLQPVLSGPSSIYKGRVYGAKDVADCSRAVNTNRWLVKGWAKMKYRPKGKK